MTLRKGKEMISHVRVIDLSEAELARCRELSYGDDGYMCEDIEVILKTEANWRYRYSQAILLRQDDEIIGWALMQPMPRSRKWSAQLFIDEKHRRKGHGTTLLKEANRWCPAPYVYLDRDNREFFMRTPELYKDWEYA